jgi:hypothetical protein
MLTRLLDIAFGRPRGLLGRIGGAIMARGNADQEQRATDRAGPGGRLVIFVHRHVLPVTAAQLSAEAAEAGFTELTVSERDRRFNSPAVELTGRAKKTT